MSVNQNAAELKTKLSTLKNTILSGKSALDGKQLQVVNEMFESFVKEAVEIDMLKKDEALTEFKEILASSIPAQLAYGMMEKINPDIYFNLGNFLYNLLKGSDVINKNIITKVIHQYLNLFRLSQFLKKIYDDNRWEDLIYNLINGSNFNFRELFKQRVKIYGNKTLFNVITGKTVSGYSWQEVDETIDVYSQSMFGLASEFNIADFKVAFLMENSINMAMLDLSCLTSGIVNIMIPANSVSQHVTFILNQTEAPFLFVSNEKQLSKIKSIKQELIHLKQVILLEGSSAEEWVITFDEFLSKQKLNTDKINRDIDINSLASVMYTSGTTGEPKGIMFSNMNIVYKRFCRAMALPKIGDNDGFLAYLPLYHTFGRWFEMTGSVFWGASYSFMENPALETMIADMQLVKPTIFISIPKKWIQLYDFIGAHVSLELDDVDLIKKTVKNNTGGNLKWGLSAAGYLPAEVFAFFQKNNIELMSGFGMTEATGGITMTPPGKYIPNSLGKPLPGMEIKIADDGELLIKGHYVMIGYYGKDNIFLNGEWLPTGDIMKMDENGFIEIIDRKKEIYKNVKGETIAPQKIENYFRDFENVKQVFLAGDHRPFNTVLIFPNFEVENSILENMSNQEIKDYFASVIVSVNKFLAPFERIVNFRIINRPFSVEKGELTPKGTYKRRVIEKNFHEQLEEMYIKDHTSVYIDNVEIKIPNWFLREKGCLSGDIYTVNGKLEIPKLNSSLVIKRIDPKENIYRIGDYEYKINNKHIDLQDFLTNPLYWCGNQNLFEFTGETIVQWHRQSRVEKDIEIVNVISQETISNQILEHFQKIEIGKETSLIGLHYALLLLRSDDEGLASEAVNYIRFLLSDKTIPIYKTALHFISFLSLTKSLNIRRKLFRAAIPRITLNAFYGLFRTYLNSNPDFLNEDLSYYIIEGSSGKEELHEIEDILMSEIKSHKEEDIKKTSIPVMLNLLAKYGIRHPTRYSEVRQMLARLQVWKENYELAVLAETARKKLRKGFRTWLGKNESVAVDVETGEEYQWKDVIIVEEGVDEILKDRIIKGISETAILRETIFLFTKGVLIHLDSILPSGIWVSQVSNTKTKAAFKVTIQTRLHGAFELLLTLNKKLPKSEIKQEIKWLIIAGTKFYVNELVEDFGGYWQEYDLWTQKYLPGDTVAKLIKRELRREDETNKRKLYHLWPYFVWNAAAAYVNFWKLTESKLQLENSTIDNFIIPFHDYQSGNRIVSLTEKSDFTDFKEFFRNFHVKFIHNTENEYPFLHRDSIWNYVFSGVINAQGQKNGLIILKQFKLELESVGVPEEMDNVQEKLDLFLLTIKEKGYIPKQLYFAIKRFHRWFKLNDNAAIEAQAEMLSELYDTYNLSDLNEYYPETRTRFFLETCFADSVESLKIVLLDLVKKQHSEKISQEKLLSYISKIQTEFSLNKKESYFLTRLSYPHLKPTDSAELLKIRGAGAYAANLAVQFEDHEGNIFLFRNPISPKEIARLHNLFLAANLQVHFRPEHQFLVALSEREYIIGGLFYIQTDKKTVHMEKIVVADPYRRKGISDGLMNEFFNRLRDEKIKFVTTGFFRPEYFYKFGFKIERKYSGLVKKLEG
ncbi:long-chain-fatty-acid--CoA ligase FadD15 [bacterium BMS3Abin04]|nr:long-chain-fatty-acid--CoA ligase FadD15 [bacterium BMS3Abin04]